MPGSHIKETKRLSIKKVVILGNDRVQSFQASDHVGHGGGLAVLLGAQ